MLATQLLLAVALPFMALTGKGTLVLGSAHRKGNDLSASINPNQNPGLFCAIPRKEGDERPKQPTQGKIVTLQSLQEDSTTQLFVTEAFSTEGLGEGECIGLGPWAKAGFTADRGAARSPPSKEVQKKPGLLSGLFGKGKK